MGDGQHLLGTGNGHIAKSALFFHLVPITNGAHAGEQTVFKANQIHMGKLQALGRVHSHQYHCIITVVIFLDIGIQGNLFQEACQSGNFRIFHIGQNAGFQFTNVLQAGLVFLCILGIEHIHITGTSQQFFVEISQVHAIVQQLCQAFDQHSKLHQFSGRFFQRCIGIRITHHLIHGNGRSSRQAFHIFQCLCTQASGRIIDDPLQPQIIGPIVDHAQIGNHILDFCPVKETGATNDPVRNRIELQSRFHSIGLGIGTIKDGMVLKPFALRGGKNTTDNKIRFCPLVRCLIHRNRFACTIVGPKPFSLTAQIMGNHRIGRIQNGLCRTIVLLQANHTGATVLLFKIQNIFDGGATETIDTLIIVTHYTNIFIATCQNTGQQILGMVGILIFVHQHITEFPLIICPHIFVFLQQFNCQQNNIIKVNGIIILQPFLIGPVSFSNMLSAKITGNFCPLGVFLRGDQLVLFSSNNAQHIFCRECLIIQAHVLDDLFHDPFRVSSVVNGKMRRISHTLCIPAKDPATGRVESHGPHILPLRAQHGAQPLF